MQKQSIMTMAAIMHAPYPDIIPQLMVSSPAVRTTETSHIISEALALPKVIFDKHIYEASEETLLQIVNNFDDQFDLIALTGHNPGVSYLLFYLTGEMKDVTPGAAILITFGVNEWKAVGNGSGTISFYTAPQH
jgi:phosphohistidine phosphatase